MNIKRPGMILVMAAGVAAFGGAAFAAASSIKTEPGPQVVIPQMTKSRTGHTTQVKANFGHRSETGSTWRASDATTSVADTRGTTGMTGTTDDHGGNRTRSNESASSDSTPTSNDDHGRHSRDSAATGSTPTTRDDHGGRSNTTNTSTPTSWPTTSSPQPGPTTQTVDDHGGRGGSGGGHGSDG